MDRSFVRQIRGARRRVMVAASGGAAAVLGVVCWWLVHRGSACERAARAEDHRRAATLCRASYERTGDPDDLLAAANAAMYLGDIDAAERLAQPLITSRHYGDAHRILSYVAVRQTRGSVARLHASIALVADSFTRNERGQMRDFVMLSRVAWQDGELTTALATADEALRLARRLRDAHSEVTAALTRADALRRIGDRGGAIEALMGAADRAAVPCDRAWVHLKLGMARMEASHDGIALAELAEAIAANQQCGHRDIANSARLNRAWLLRDKDASGALVELDELARTTHEGTEELLLRGYLAADRGQLADAERDLALAAAATAPDADWPWEVERAQGELAELGGGVLGDLLAEYHYRRAASLVAPLRSRARARSAYVVSSHRAPYDDLIALLARQGRWRDALAVVLELDASDMLRATSDEGGRGEAAPDDAAAPSAPPRPASSVDDVLAAWGQRELVIVIAPARRRIGAGHERTYRLQIAGGRITGDDVGDAVVARAWADQLFHDPGDPDTARDLGRMIVPQGSSDATLHVLAIGRLGRVPLAALRGDDGGLLIARRPLARVLALEATGPESRGAGGSLIIADPLGDLPAAAMEGSAVAEVLGPRARIAGSGMQTPATRSLLWSARDAELLHVAGHVRVLGRWRELHLADGDVSPAEMVQQRLAPRIAVLAGCGSAAAMDEEGWGSIAAALLTSGTAVVIATDRSIDDAASLVVMRELYAQPDWQRDPSRALARVQQALDTRAAGSGGEATRARSWAAFSVMRRPPVVAGRP